MSTTLTRPLRGAPEDPRWSRPALLGLLAVALVLYAWGLRGYANEYYSAAVLSATQSWKAFFFGALDAGNFITVDKPPLALWVMALSARVFGFHTWSLLLPHALAGVATVALVFSTVRRGLEGRVEAGQAHAAGLVAAAVTVLTPVTVAINRDNTPDALLVLLLVLAVRACLEAVRGGRLRHLLLSALFVGLAFNAKMLQAYLIVPALALAYLVCARTSVGRRVAHLLAAGGVMLVSSLWWMVVVDLWPASSRPFIGGSTNNTVRDLVIGYNGLARLLGEGSSAPGGATFGGPAGPERLFNAFNAGQISWLLPFCALALVFAAVQGLRRRQEADHADGADGAPAQPLAAWLVWGGWLVVHYVVFSFSAGTFHPYYTTAMAPAVGAITGMGGVLMWRAYRESRAWSWVLPAGV
uniref:glycosyltransferase family 39 protein n=1 Tax=Nocardia aurea TaxID=2144174 RepID=UPI0018E56B79